MRLIRNDRQQKIDSFLKFWKEVLVQNPDIELNNSSIIYNELIRIGVPESERKINVHDVGLFDYWVRYFSKANNINVFDFQNFIANYYNSKLISNQVGDIEIFNDMDDRETRPNFERSENYKQVTELIVSSLKKEFSYDDYLQHFYKNKGELYNTQDENVYYDAITMYKYAIEKSCGKYGIEIGMSQIHSYIKTGKENYLTGNGNFRYIMIRADFREKILNLSAEMDYDMIVLQDKKQILDEAIVATHDKYKEYPTNSGNLFIVESLNNYLKTGTPSNFTRDNNHRENLINCISADELLKIVSSSLGIKISEQYLNSKEYVSMISSQYINSIYEEKNISAGQS